MLVEVTGYVDRLREALVSSAAAGGEAVVDAAERLAMTLDPAVRMTLLEAFADAAAEITAELDGTTVEVRLKGRDPHFVVSTTGAGPAFAPPPPPGSGRATECDIDDATIARITLRIPDGLKQRAEDAAGQARQSVNTWIVEAVRSAATGPEPTRHSRGVGQQLSGWVR